MRERLDCGDSGCLSPERSRGGMRTNGGCQWGKSPGEMLGHVSLPLEAWDQAGDACELVGWRCAGASVGDEAAYVGVTALCETEGGAL